MKRLGVLQLCVLSALLWLQSGASAQSLQVQFGAQGLERISFHGQIVADTTRWSDDRLHIWHMKCVDLASGHVRTDGEYGWGENNRGRSWDAASRSWHYAFVWGSLSVQYVPHGDVLDMRVTASNHAGSGVILDGASVYPVTLHIPNAEAGLGIQSGAEQPVSADLVWKQGRLTAATADAIYAGFQPGKDAAYALLASSTPPDSLPEAAGLPGQRVQPGSTSTFSISLRFGQTRADDLMQSWLQHHASTLAWRDHRILGTVFLASSGQGDKSRSAGFPGNPRRYFNDASLDIRTEAGLRNFQKRVLERAGDVVNNLRRLNAQGAITWDIEGEQYPQNTTYVCAPDEIARTSPEMESVVSAGLPHAGMKLDDAYFRIIHDAGFRVGVCVRPQHFQLSADGTARQQFLPLEKVAEELIRKMRYAHDRWGATVFYLDSTVREGGWTLPAEVLAQAAHALPDSLLIPEEATPGAYAFSVPFRSFVFHGETGLSPALRLLYPNAFVANLINDVDPDKLTAHHAELVEAVRKGDILMVHAGYWHPNNAVVMRIYREAAQTK